MEFKVVLVKDDGKIIDGINRNIMEFKVRNGGRN